ncbi:hypothetical protein BDZ91DRAFT_741240 [Kalaharituber pfeilii]|nr:hypothetical protein BDZ91DRAFT_741240 [Kalaharituber pfeilii]
MLELSIDHCLCLSSGVCYALLVTMPSVVVLHLRACPTCTSLSLPRRSDRLTIFFSFSISSLACRPIGQNRH